jgi:hypothetical protein
MYVVVGEADHEAGAIAFAEASPSGDDDDAVRRRSGERDDNITTRSRRSTARSVRRKKKTGRRGRPEGCQEVV